jgi:hypothetical protein
MANLTRRCLLLGTLALPLAGCDTLDSLNPFAEHKKPLPGVRHQVPVVDTRPRPAIMPMSGGMTETTVGPQTPLPSGK